MKFRKIIVFSLFLYGANILFGQGQLDPRIQSYRNDPKGEFKYRREGVMDGNLVRTLFYNNGEVAQWPFQPSGEWPKGTGHSYCDGVTVLISAAVKAPGTGQIVHPLEASYREHMATDPVTGEIWGLEPVPGYLNPSQKKPAINKDPLTFPQTWPAALGLPSSWDGYWYGYFGRGVMNADFETFFVMDDSKDSKFKRSPFNFYPIASDSSRGGLGLRVEVRGFQWSHVLAEDIIFWHYDIVNISDNNYDTTCFGFYTDAGVGGTNNNGNSALFDRRLALAYAWAPSGKGVPGNWKTGYYGYAYLESPGNPFDGIDNDFDGLVDERRDNNIDDDHDWIPYTDLNGNGKWDPDEPLNNDVGRDGVGPQDPQYKGPDEGEGDGIPTHGEPNFDETDKDESDQIGLTAESIYILADTGPTGGWPKNNEVMWRKMNSGFVDTMVQNTNISLVFASGPFQLKQGRRERFSMALLFGNDLEDLVFNKVTVQNIYNANYNFSKPPYTPHLKAVAGNKRVFLYWDAIAETFRNSFLGFEDKNNPQKGYKKDFEGYLLYRSSEAEFNDIKVITDSKGDAKYWKPLAQWDLIDEIKGSDPVGINGAHFWRGDNTGIQHSYIDTNVCNGQRYYYALVSYSKGDPNFGTTGLQPSECTKVITEDYAGNLKFVDINCAVVTPNAPAAGYLPPEVSGNQIKVNGLGSGRITTAILNPLDIINGAEYRITFNSKGSVPSYQTTSYNITRSFNGKDTTIFTGLDTSNFGGNRFSPPFDGVAVSVINDTTITIIDSLTNWLVGKSNLTMSVYPDNSNANRNIAWPADYQINFYNKQVSITPFTKIPLNFIVLNTTTGDTVAAELFDRDNSGTLSVGDDIVLVQYADKDMKLTWRIEYHATPKPGVKPVEPQDGDKFIIATKRSFLQGDYFTFKTKGSSTDISTAKNAMNKISVVPNPYIAATSWERRTLNQTGRGDRKIDFINLPAKCEIKIYTMAGYLVKVLYKDTGSMTDPCRGIL